MTGIGLFFFFFKQKTAYEVRISDWSSDVCSSDLLGSSGYGLPQPSEWQRLESESSLRQKQLQTLTGDLDKEVRALLEPSRAAEITASEDNVKRIGEHLRKLHKAGGGLELP